ncbi:hypothetical protein MFLO_06902 [Listeria floridensis FSL S10-1187]|uniref:DUF1027 domain-containing protein n=1 Tax=Listeria floridensis FSL S10-1187 TaxID=1265817 RepID=A0ABN0RFT1_9LIST|nr:YutD family protein [Listeria floridensis]EUJ32430.1 hypothetical protein MFLO_06902 [Listeria floridensis FSL S10-1187]
MITIQNQDYELVKDHRDCFDEEKLNERFSDILLRYDYIVGDYGYDQLRLKGFFEDGNKKATYDNKISTLNEYLYEYCNFGCSYFVLKKMKKPMKKAEKGE